MNSQELRALQEAYNQVYELDEGKKKFPTDKVNNQATKHEKDYLKNPNSSGSSLFKSRKMKAIKSTVDAGSDPRKTIHGQDLRKLGTKNFEEVDLYDIILSHLLDEGYADTEQAAEAIMVNMSEDWREDIVEKHATFGYNADDPGDDFDQFVQKGPKTNKQKRQAIELNKKILSKKKN